MDSVLDKLKSSLPNLHSATVSEKELFTKEEKKVSIDQEIADSNTRGRITEHIFNSNTIEKLEEVKAILNSSGYVDEFKTLLDLRESEIKGQVNNFDNYLFHPHSVGKIMGGIPKPLTDSQDKMFLDYTARKNGEGKPLTDKQLAAWGDLFTKKTAKVKLNEAAKKELDKIFWRTTTGRSKKIQAKQLDKGVLCEDVTIKLYEDVKGGFFVKNKERLTNKWFNGECDNSQGKIRDVKTSWEFETFPANENKIPNSNYEWQLDAYMDLWNMKESELIYGLVDTPFDMINSELYRLDNKLDVLTHEGNVRDNKIEVVVELVLSHIYTRQGLIDFCEYSENVKLSWFIGKFTEIPKEKRIKVYHHDYNEERNKLLKDMIVLAREYLNELLITK